MSWYKIAQESPFYSWFSNEILRLTDNYKKDISDSFLNSQILSEIAENFSDIPPSELKKIQLKDLYVINYIIRGTANKFKAPVLITERLSGVSREWLNDAVKNFPELLMKYTYKQLETAIEKYPISYLDIPEIVKTILPEEIKEKITKYYEKALVGKWCSYRDVPEDLRSRLSEPVKEYVINSFVEAFKDSSKQGLEIIPEDIRDKVLERIIEINDKNI